MNNLLLKIACLVVAILVWILVALTTMVEADVGLPMDVVGVVDDWTVAGSALPDQVQVRLRVPKLKLMAHDYLGMSLGTVQMDLENFQPGPPALYVLKESDVRTEAEVVMLLPPVRLAVRLDWFEQRRLPVQVPLRGALGDDLMLAGVVRTIPDSVVVAGPRRLFRELHALVTDAVDLNELQVTFTGEVSVEPPPEPLQLETPTVQVVVPIVTLDERVIANVPVVPLDSGERSAALISPPVCDVLVRGPADSVGALSPARLVVSIDVAGLDVGVHQASASLSVPGWATAFSVEPAEFMVIVEEPAETREER